MNYKEEIKKSLNYLKSDFILDYTNTPNEELLESYFKFCKKCLNNFSETAGIKPNIIVFNISQVINARAGKAPDGTYIITINQGIFDNCISNYLLSQSLANYINKKFDYTSNSLDTNINLLAYQVTTQFTFYHELAHLIQLTKTENELELQERQENDEKYCPIQHKLEINADTFASIAISTHIQQYCERVFGGNLNSINFEETIIIICSCLFNYLNLFSSANDDIYYKERKHPHPFFRVLLITMNIANHFNRTKFLENSGIRLNYFETFKKVIDFNEELEKNGIFETDFYSNIDNNIKDKEKMVSFMSELIIYDCDDKYYNAMDGWNENIT